MTGRKMTLEPPGYGALTKQLKLGKLRHITPQDNTGATERAAPAGDPHAKFKQETMHVKRYSGADNGLGASCKFRAPRHAHGHSRRRHRVILRSPQIFC